MAERILTPEEEILEDPIGYKQPNPKGDPLSFLGGFVSTPFEFADLMTSTSPVKRMLGQTDTPTKTELLHQAMPESMQQAMQDDPASYMLGGMATPGVGAVAKPIAKTANQIIKALGEGYDPNTVGSILGNIRKRVNPDIKTPQEFDKAMQDANKKLFAYQDPDTGNQFMVKVADLDDVPVNAVPDDMKKWRLNNMKKDPNFKPGGSDNIRVMGSKNIKLSRIPDSGLDNRFINEYGKENYDSLMKQAREWIENTPPKIIDRGMESTLRDKAGNVMDNNYYRSNQGTAADFGSNKTGLAFETVNVKGGTKVLQRKSPRGEQGDIVFQEPDKDISKNTQVIYKDKNGKWHANCTCHYFATMSNAKGDAKLGGLCKHLVNVFYNPTPDTWYKVKMYE